MIHHVPSPQLKIVRSPLSRPSAASIGASFACPGAGSREAMTRSSQSSAPAPLTSYRENPEMSTSPTRSRTASHSSATIGNALERLSVGVSSKPGGANSSGVSRPHVQPHRQPAPVMAS